MSETVEVSINGESARLASPASVADAVRQAGIGSDVRGVAVAVDGDVVPRSRWREETLVAGQSVEVVQAIQGGRR